MPCIKAASMHPDRQIEHILHILQHPAVILHMFPPTFLIRPPIPRPHSPRIASQWLQNDS